jgi:hypothetical protein
MENPNLSHPSAFVVPSTSPSVIIFQAEMEDATEKVGGPGSDTTYLANTSDVVSHSSKVNRTATTFSYARFRTRSVPERFTLSEENTRFSKCIFPNAEEEREGEGTGLESVGSISNFEFPTPPAPPAANGDGDDLGKGYSLL